MRYAQGGGFDAAGRARCEQVRLRAAELIDASHRDAEIAERLRVTPESVCRWRAAYRRAGAAGLSTNIPRQDTTATHAVPTTDAGRPPGKDRPQPSTTVEATSASRTL